MHDTYLLRVLMYKLAHNFAVLS